MCGICGWVNNRNDNKSEILKDMCDAIKHRGPDDEGYYTNGKMAIGMRRLSIIDLSLGHQPIHNEDESIWIVFNGEIYNYLELREELESAGHKFYTNSDTEVIVHLYEEQGEKTPEKLRGMFAFAIMDKKRDHLFIARDRIGIKPLYYYWNGVDFLFASEIKSLLKFPDYRKKPDLCSINQYFTFGYVPNSRTMFEGIRKLLPGHFLVLKNHHLRQVRYWSLSNTATPELPFPEYIEQFFHLFTDCVKRHLISDVPLGMFLSGGIDSSLIVGIMSKTANRQVETFSIGYEGDGSVFDERIYSRKVSEIFHTKHREFIIRPDIIDVLPKIIDQCDEPVGDASVIPSYYLSKYVRQHVTVALSGLGGDELCGGYERYLGALMADYYNRLPSFFREKINDYLINLPDSPSGNQFPQRLKRFAMYASYPLKNRYYHFIGKFSDNEKDKLFDGLERKEMDMESGYKIYDQYWEKSMNLDELRKLLMVDKDTFLVDDLLALTDRVSMAHSLEVRVPFLDHVLMEYFWNIPSKYKIKGLSKKYLLKKAAEKILPKEIIYRKKKGFSIPLAVWFRDSLKEYVKEILNEQNLKDTGMINRKYVERIIEEHGSGKTNHDEKIYMLISFVIWYKKYFSGINNGI